MLVKVVVICAIVVFIAVGLLMGQHRKQQDKVWRRSKFNKRFKK